MRRSSDWFVGLGFRSFSQTTGRSGRLSRHKAPAVQQKHSNLSAGPADSPQRVQESEVVTRSGLHAVIRPGGVALGSTLVLRKAVSATI